MGDLTLYYRNRRALRKSHPALYARLDPLLSAAADSAVLPLPSPFEPALVQSVRQSLAGGMDFLYLHGLDGRVLIECAPEILCENRGILVIEPSVSRFENELRGRDLAELFCHRRLFWAVGPDWREQAAAVFDDTLCAGAASPVLHFGRTAEDEEAELGRNCLEWVRREVVRRKSELVEGLRTLPERLRRRREDPARTLRIWSFLDIRTCARFSIIQHVLIRTLFFHLRRMGFEALYTVLRPGGYYPPYYRVLRMALFEPDLIFLCNDAPAYESGLGAELSRSLPVPKVVWFADDPVHAEHLLKRHKITPDETYLVADHEWGAPLIENGAGEVLYMPGAATKRRRGARRGERKCEVVFVGQVRDQSDFFSQLSPGWKAYCQRVIAEKLRFPRTKIREVMDRFDPPARLEEDRLDELRQKILWEANTRFRVQVILQLARFDLRVYGNEDWRRFLPPDTARRAFRGVLPFQALFETYRNAGITLNIHSLQSYTCLNVRDFDVPASGGFLLSDWLPRAEDVFVPGFAEHLPLAEDAAQEVFFYRSIPEVARLVEYFLSHEDERQACIERAREKVMARHTYEHRAEWLADLFRKRIEGGGKVV